MVKVTYKINQDDVELKLEGHANYAEIGKDIVCSAISTLVLTLALMVEGDKEMGEGYFRIVIPMHNVSYFNYLDFVVKGLHELEQQYPENVQIAYK